MIRDLLADNGGCSDEHVSHDQDATVASVVDQCLKCFEAGRKLIDDLVDFTRLKSIDDGSPLGPRSDPICRSRSSKNAVEPERRDVRSIGRGGLVPSRLGLDNS